MNGVVGMKRNSGHIMSLPNGNGNGIPQQPDYGGKRARKVVSDVRASSSCHCLMTL